MKPRRSGLERRAFTQLTPEVFSHPVWEYFLSQRGQLSPESIEILEEVAREREGVGDTETCCQILFVCTFLYHSAGEDEPAFHCLEKILELAKAYRLIQVARPAAWAFGSLYFQHGEKGKTVEQLRWLRDEFLAAGDWVMGDALELFRLSLASQGERGDQLAFVYDWLGHWGEINLDRLSTDQVEVRAGSRTSFQRWVRILCHSIARYFRIFRTALRRSLEDRAGLHVTSGFSKERLDEPEIAFHTISPASTEWPVEQDTAPSPAVLAPVLNHIQANQVRLNPPRPVAPEFALDRSASRPPSMAIYCLGPFKVYQDDQLISNWPSGKGKAIFKFMVANFERPISKDILMDTFWRDFELEAARKNLYVAIHGLRQAFRARRPDFPQILFEDDHYLLNPAMALWIDVQEFMRRYQAGQSLANRRDLIAAVKEFEAAESLYQGDFLEEDLYEDWPLPRREGLKDSYLAILGRLSRYYLDEKRYATCIYLCQKILYKDDCREDAHRRLIRCYSRQGHRHLALRQYHLCVEALARVLDVPPMRETVSLYQQILNGEEV